MGLWDRDYWRERAKERDWKDSYYDPKKFRGGRQPGRGSKGPPSGGRGWYSDADNPKPIRVGRSVFWSLFVWVAIGGLIWYGFHHGQPKQWLDRWFTTSSSAPILDHPKNCVTFPPSGTVQRFMDKGAEEGRRMTKVEIANHHDFPVVAVFSDLNGPQKFQAVAVGSESIASLQMPVGRYDLILHAGEASRWCNLQRGFSGGASVQMNGGLVVRGMATTQVALKSTANTPEGFSVTYSAKNAQSSDARASGINTQSNDTRTPSGAGVLRLTQTKDGHYFSGGAVNGFPVVFMVDTGATNVAISSNTASRAGITSCVARTFSTANGSVQGCKAIVENIVFGTFRLSNVEVAIMPNMQGEALLGMNVLKGFHIEQAHGVLTVSVK